MGQHITVLKQETVEALNLKSGGVYVDATLGNAGHSLEILSSKHDLTLIAIDLDKDAILNLESELEKLNFVRSGEENKFTNNNQTVYILQANFANLQKELQKLSIDKIDGLIADLGWSTDQMDTVAGLSYSQESALDMRFDMNLAVTAADLLNALGLRELEQMFYKFSDLRGGLVRKLSQQIIDQRKERTFATTSQLVEVITALTSDQRDVAQVFQALRIAVNSELINLQELLVQAYKLLNQKGKLAIITFHSKEEDVIFKFAVDNKINVPEAIRPSVEELRNNLKARSAKLWVLEKVATS